MQTIEALDGYDRTKTPRKLKLRALTLDEIKASASEPPREGTPSFHTLKALDLHGKARDVRVASKLKLWKRDTGRAELSVKYGLYETIRIHWADGTSDFPLYVEV